MAGQSTGQSADDVDAAAAERSTNRLVAVTLDESSIGCGNPDQEHERAIAIFDILEENSFTLPGRDHGPYSLVIGLVENKLSFAISTESGEPVMTHLLSLTPFRGVIRVYAMFCDSYFHEIGRAPYRERV